MLADVPLLLIGLGMVAYAVLALAYLLVALGLVWVLRRLAAVPLELDEAAR